MILPNGMDIVDVSGPALRAIYHEIFVEQCYSKNGIVFKDEMRILDLGANVGLFPIWLGTFLQRAEVHCYEPVPTTYVMGLQNLKRYDKLGVRYSSVGIASRGGWLPVNVSKGLSQVSSLLDIDVTTRDEANVDYIYRRYLWWMPLIGRWLARRILRKRIMKDESVVMCRFETFPKGHWDFVKMDIEGAELQVLSSIKEWSIDQMVLEIHRDFKEVMEILQSHFEVTVEDSPLMPSLKMAYCRRVS